MSHAIVEVPASIANLGPGFDVLGACLDAVWDKVTVELHHGPAEIRHVSGRDAALVPRDPNSNACTHAARAMLSRLKDDRQPVISIERAIPIAAGLGSSAAASVAGALGAAAASGKHYESAWVLAAALSGEASVAGRHLDNIAPCLYGGITIVRSVDPAEVYHIAPALPLVVAVVTPATRLDTKAARAMLPDRLPTQAWVQQMANTASLVYGLTSNDVGAIANALNDQFAEPARKHAIPNFDRMRQAALDAGALGFGISGAGPSVFALCRSTSVAHAAAQSMGVMAGDGASAIVGLIAKSGARCLS